MRLAFFVFLGWVMADNTYAILIDAGFFSKRFVREKLHHPNAEEIDVYCGQYKKIPYFQQSALYRIFYYNARPTREIHQNNPLDIVGGPHFPFSNSTVATAEATWKKLTEKPFFAMRQGSMKKGGWKLADGVLEDIVAGKRANSLGPKDIKLEVNQKQVDLKIGMDVAHLAFKCLVQKIILITNDADLAPAAKLARVEGIQVFLDPMNKSVPEELVKHTDVILRTAV
jgi:uncharacterized LabA/DUF88 family protein